MAGQCNGAGRARIRIRVHPQWNPEEFLRWIKTWPWAGCQAAGKVKEVDMNTVEWSDALQLDYEPMDAVHREFVALLALAQNAPDATLPLAWAAVVDHTVEHFGREDEWMRKTRFSAAENHIIQHRVVLNVLREGLALARAGQLDAVREMAGELAVWFAKHTQSLDAALALHMRREPAGGGASGRTRGGNPTAHAHL
jgi:hemerythrin-like metal-binding protein